MGKKVELMIVRGVEGNCVVLNSRRVAGPKAWGGGRILHTFTVDVDDIVLAVVGALEARQARVIRKALDLTTG